MDPPEALSPSLVPTAEGAATVPKRAPTTRPTLVAVRRLLRDRSAVVGLVILALLAIAAVLAPVIAPYSPFQPHYDQALQGPGRDFLLGTDGLGRDVLSRLLYGARISLASVTLAAVTFALSIGPPAGGLKYWAYVESVTSASR